MSERIELFHKRRIKNTLKLPYVYLKGLIQWMYPEICPRCNAEFGYTRFGYATNRYLYCSDCRDETGNNLVIDP